MQNSYVLKASNENNGHANSWVLPADVQILAFNGSLNWEDNGLKRRGFVAVKAYMKDFGFVKLPDFHIYAMQPHPLCDQLTSKTTPLALPSPEKKRPDYLKVVK